VGNLITQTTVSPAYSRASDDAVAFAIALG